MKLKLMLIFVVMLFSWQAFSGNLIFASKEELKRVHSALLETIFPFEDTRVASEHKKDLLNQSDKIFEEVYNHKDARQVLQVFANIKQLSNPLLIRIINTFVTHEGTNDLSKENFSEIRRFVKQNNTPNPGLAIYDLPLEKRRELFRLLLNSKVNFLRRMAYIGKTLYITKIYTGKIAEDLSGISHPEETNNNSIPSPKFQASVSYNIRKKVINEKFDYIVVGSGVAGSVVVHELQKAGKKVLLMEKGPFIIPGAVNAKDNFKFMDYGGLRSSTDGSMYFLNGAVSGGGSSVNIDMSYPPTLPYIGINFERWRTEGKIPQDVWSPESIRNSYEWVKNKFQPRTVEPEELNANNNILKVGAEALGLKWSWFDLLTYKDKTEWQDALTDKKSAVDILLKNTFEDKNNPVAFLPNSKVLNVLHKNKQAYGVRFIVEQGWNGKGILNDPMGLNIEAGTVVEAYADRVILSAGTLGTSLIMHQSKIKNKNIGKGIVSHPFAPIIGYFENEINAHKGTLSSVYVDHFLTTKKSEPKDGFLIESAGGNPALIGVMVPGNPKQIYENISQSKNMAGLGVILVEETRVENRIDLGKNGNPEIHYSLSQKDKARFAKGLATGIRILFKAGATKVSMNNYQNFFPGQHGEEYKFFTDIKEADLVEKNLELIPNQALMMGAHMMGSNKLGVDPETSVVNGRHESWDVKSLYVVDASVFPESVGANPMQSIYTMAKMFTESHLKVNK